MPCRDAKRSERGATADDQGAVIRIDDRERAGTVRTDFDGLVAQAEKPGLRVVTGGGEDRIAQKEADLLRGVGVRGILDLGHRPRLQRRIDACVLHYQHSLTWPVRILS